MKTLYLYPNGEDSQVIYVVLQELQKRGYINYDEILFVDDNQEGAQINHLRQEIQQNGELWIVHQDKSIYDKLCQNADGIPFVDGMEALEEILCNAINEIKDREIKQNIANNAFCLLNVASYFLLHFYISLNKQSAFVQTMQQIAKHIQILLQSYFKINVNAIGIPITNFSGGKHLGKIGDILEKRGIAVKYIANDLQILHSLLPDKKKNAIICPWQNGFIGILVNPFKLQVTCLMPHTAPNWGNKTIYVSHAYIDPIASLIQRRRPLDDFWFSKKMGINGYRIVTSLSNYKIFKDKFDEFGYQDELVCGGYPSLDSYIAEYEEISKEVECGGGDNILIAINENNNVQIVYEVLQKIQDKMLQSKSDFKVIFRPHPSLAKSAMYEIVYREFRDKEWFVYDTSSRLSAEAMHSSFCLIGDHSSLVYTFPLCTLKPAILLVPKESLQNTYKGISFYNPILHICAQTAQDIYKALECINQENKQERAKQIKQYREKEVFNLGHSSEFIADFIEGKLREIP